MINRTQLLADLQTVLRRLETDLLERSEEMPEVSKALKGEHQRARTAERTAQSYEDWRSDYLTQIAAAWVLSCVFVRFLEDNRLVDPPRIAGPGERLARARDEHELYFRAHPTETDREYLLHVFDELARLPGAKDIFGAHNPIHELPTWLSGDAAGALVHDFTDPDWDTRFLGDLYQDLSEAARKKYALLQTPEFVEEFILDRTLDPAIEEFGLEGFRMIDPACGSGHFLLGSFARFLNRWQKKEPSTNVRELVQQALDSVHGVDVNPYAVAITRFRLLLAAMKACGVQRLTDAPAFHLNLACGDSLIHGSGTAIQQYLGDWDPIEHVYHSEEFPELCQILHPRHYHAVVANPPYITPKDKALNQAYRERYSACHKQYSLSVPFMQRILSLGILNGYTGQITANSFIFNEFGKKLVEDFLPNADMTHVIDTSLAFIPEHGTPTVIILGRTRPPVSDYVRAVLGIRREDKQPKDPTKGKVWTAILNQIDIPGSQSEFVSVEEAPRERFSTHPWVLRGGGAGDLKELIEAGDTLPLSKYTTEIGRTTHTGADDVFELPPSVSRTRRFRHYCVPFLTGDSVRNYLAMPSSVVVFTYNNEDGRAFSEIPPELVSYLWPLRTLLRARQDFGIRIEDRGLRWYQHSMFFRRRYLAKRSITFPCVSTHNHFVVVEDKSVSNPHAPRIFLSDETGGKTRGVATILNSSTAGFWMRQVMRDKGGGGIGGGIAAEAWERFFEYVAAKLQKCPVVQQWPNCLIEALYTESREFACRLTANVVRSFGYAPTKSALCEAKERWLAARRRLIFLQEELDWWSYSAYSLLSEPLLWSGNLIPIELGERAFEILMARKMGAGELETMWFERHGSKPITEIPGEWPEDYRKLVERRIELIETDRNIGLIEQPEYKRRWNTEPWESQLERALRNWLLARLESYFDFDGRMNDESKPTAKIDIALTSTARLADVARQDVDFMQVGELYRNDPAFDVHRLVANLVESESVPLLPVLRYQPSGLRKRMEWGQTWDLQRQEDAIDTRTKLPKDDPQSLTALQAQALKRHQIGDIPVPPRYTSSDFASSTYWRLRGKLDVSKERWVSFPHCEGADGTLMIAWAGYDHLQLASAISAYYADIQERLGGRDDPRLAPLLACLIELLPWLKQWHNDVDPEFGMRMGDYFEGFIQEEARQMGQTLAQIKAWEPPKKIIRRRKQSTG